jgi:uncharacterized membrane protein YcaP (DUF421 family)
MDAVLRALFIYLILMLVFRATGKRSMAQLTTFDFVLLLIIGEATQQALLGEDFSLTNASIVIVTLIVVDVAIARLARRSARLKRIVESLPVVLLRDGRMQTPQMEAQGIEAETIRERARVEHGLGSLAQVEHAVLEASGQISIIPRSEASLPDRTEDRA